MNNYFNDFEREERQIKQKAIPAWAWIVAVVGLAVAIIWGYSMGRSSAALMNMGTIEDTTPDSFDLGVLDFSDPLYIFGDSDLMLGYNFIDYPSFANYYDSGRKENKYGGYDNAFGSDTSFSVEFLNLNYYDIPCVFGTDEDTTVNITFESSVTSGNLEARILILDKKYQTEPTSDGYIKIKSEYIKSEFEFKANDIVTKSFEYDADTFIVLAVAGESAVGSFNFQISIQS